MLSGNHYIPSCNKHSETTVSAVCVAHDCFTDLCRHCLADHSKFHIQKNNYMKLVSFEDLRQETVQNLTNLKSTANSHKGYFKVPILEKITRKIRETRKTVLEIVEQTFSKLEKDAADAISMASNQANLKEDEANSYTEKFEAELEAYVKKIEQLLYIVEEGNTIITGLREANQKDFSTEWKNIEQKYVASIDKIAFSRPSNYETAIKDYIMKNFSIVTIGNSSFSFPDELRDDDILIEGSMPYLISKLMVKPATSNVLGPPLTAGIHKLVVSLEYVHSGGWIGIGAIDTKDVPLTGNIYSKAMCICSDNCAYNLGVNVPQPMLSGNAYTIIIDCTSGSVIIEGKDGYKASKTEGLLGKTMYYFLEFNGPHRAQVLSYEVVV